jgi:hypothetical protein
MGLMSNNRKIQLNAIYLKLRELRESVNTLEKIEIDEVEPLSGHQTVDSEGALTLAMLKLRDQIAVMEETLAMIAEATGDKPKL